MSWHKSLSHHLNKHKKYPHEARKSGDEGVAAVSFTLDRSGKVISSHLDKSSGSDLLDKEAIEVLSRASPFPPPPSDVPNLTINLTLPIQFRIKR
jgi:protein TonB